MPGFIICQGKPYPLLLLVLWEYNLICHLPVVHSCQAQAQPGSLSDSITFTSESQAEEKKLEVGEAITVGPQHFFQNADKMLLFISKIHRRLQVSTCALRLHWLPRREGGVEYNPRP